MSSNTKKISRKDIAKMSFGDFLRAARGPYQRLFSYLKPYRGRFYLGILFGALFGLVQGFLIFDVQFVAGTVFPDAKSKAPKLVSTYYPGLLVQAPMIFDVQFSAAVTPPEEKPKIPKFIVHFLPGLAHKLEDIHIQGSLGTVLIICSTIPVLMLLRGLCSYLNSYFMLWVSVRVLDDIRQQVFRHTLGQSMEFFNKAKTGDLVQTVFNQTRMAQQALTTISGDVVKQPISIVSALGVLFYIDWQFTLLSFIIFPLCLLPVVVVAKKVRKAGAREEEEAGQLMVVMHEAFAGIRVVKTHAREDFESERFNTANRQIMRFIMRWRKAMELAGPLVETVASFGVAGALVWAWARDLGFAKFVALNGGMVLLYPPFKAISRIHLTMQKCLAATTKVFELLDRAPAITDAPDAKPLLSCTGQIEFDNVTFSYGHDQPAVRDISLTIPAGTTCALVGASGAGKSTLLSLLQRLYEVQGGSICIDGNDIRSLTQASLREHIAVVTQDVFLFHDTIYNNIRYGRLDATREEVEEAARLAFAHDFILAQPHGYETVIGDKGCLLSGGQQQRISIARALLKNAPILLLDEAMSALDSESEKQVQAAIETLANGRSVIAIAHRLSTILKADQIVMMEHGRIESVGPHAELYSKSAAYRRLYDLQFNRLGGEEVTEEEIAAAS